MTEVLELDGIKKLTPRLIEKYVFNGSDLKTIRKIGQLVIWVAATGVDHVAMGIPPQSVASAGTIARTGRDNPALVYTPGGSSLNTTAEFKFVETSEELAITIGLIEHMLIKLGKSGISIYDPYNR